VLSIEGTHPTVFSFHVDSYVQKLRVYPVSLALLLQEVLLVGCAIHTHILGLCCKKLYLIEQGDDVLRCHRPDPHITSL
jgi:hypothetical protein